MANDLYKIELLSRVGDSDIADGTGMLYTNNGIVFVKLHPVKIKAAPKTDAVEVVRCEDCKWYKEGRILKGNKFCFRLKHPKEDRRIGYNFSPDDYGSYGERKEK